MPFSDKASKGNEPDHDGLGTRQKVLGKGMIRYGDFVQTLETIIGRGTGRDGLPPKCNPVVLWRVGDHVVDEPLGKIGEGHVCFLREYGLTGSIYRNKNLSGRL